MAAKKSHRDILECSKTFGINCNKVFQTKSYGIMWDLAKEGNLDMMKYLDENFSSFMKRSYRCLEGAFSVAIKEGNLEILEWINNEFPKYLNLTEDEHEYMFYENGEYKFGDVLFEGNLAAIKWFIDNVDFHIEDERINEIVAYRGKVEIFEAIEGHYQPVFNEEIFESAAHGHSIEMLDYLYRNNCPFNSDICSQALQTVHTEKSFAALKWLRRHDFPWDANTCLSAVFYDNLNALKWARDQGCLWDEETLVYAAGNCSSNSNMEMLEYCLQNGCPLSSRACQRAMHNKDDSKALEVLKLLRKYSCPWDEETCEDAARYGNFEAMIWARNNGCPWNRNAFLKVLSYGSTATIEYFLRAENQLLSRDGIFEAIFHSSTKGAYIQGRYLGHLDTTASDDLIITKLKLVHSFGLQLTTHACALAALDGRLRVLKWLKYMDCPWDAETCTGAVRAYELNFEILKYAHENGCEWDKNTYAHCLRYYGLSRLGQNEEIPTKPTPDCVEIAQYLEENNCPKPNENDWNREMF
ncbi:hypothetical protein CTEN210_11430 [Chaetoceros tenuissimus]|uniref:Ankyrin repeat n=1 Tax=Chaetoceros tenuissimus TaxID=426638 RepID=A0AAD3CZR1_9STRA|nr:hypothetical protein CTEN210_11430 [Chaetoceros tenuissimus]